MWRLSNIATAEDSFEGSLFFRNKLFNGIFVLSMENECAQIKSSGFASYWSLGYCFANVPDRRKCAGYAISLTRAKMFRKIDSLVEGKSMVLRKRSQTAVLNPKDQSEF